MNGLNYEELINLLPTWGYLIMFFFMIIEGPIVTMAAAFLSSLGYFNFFAVLILSILGDIVGDIILYYSGLWGGRKFLEKIIKRFHINRNLVNKLENLFHKKGAKIIFYVKATTGLCWVTFFLAGVAKMKFKQFIFYSFLGGLFWSFFLVTIGYFFGYATEEAEKYLNNVGKIIFGLAIIFVIVLGIIRKKGAEKLLSKKKID